MNKANASTLLKIEGMHCASCQRPIEKALRETPGVKDVSVNLANHRHRHRDGVFIGYGGQQRQPLASVSLLEESIVTVP